MQRRDALQRSALLEAARRRYGAVVEALCLARAHADAVDGQGRTALHVAVWGASLHIVALLLCVAEKNKTDYFGRS